MPTAIEAVRPAYRPLRPGPIQTIRQTVGDVYSRRRLIQYLVRADLKKHGADTLLGNVWWILDPLLTMAVYVVLVTVIAQNTSDAYPLFIFCAILPWKWFSSVVGASATSIVARERIIKQVQFPKIVLPLSECVGGVVSFAFGLIPLGVMMVVLFPSHLSPWVLAIPLVAAVQFLFTLGVAILLSAITVFYRDIGLLMSHLLRLWFYLSPALYGSERIQSLAPKHPEIVFLYNLNPFTGLFESYRSLIFGDAITHSHVPAWDLLGVVVVESLVLLVVGILVFRRVEPSFAKVL
jgi:lipopolysaccharide transport system permease protein